MSDVSYHGHGKKTLRQELWRHEFEEALSLGAAVVFATGSIEQRGPHCPSDVDTCIPFNTATLVAQLVEESSMLVAPPIWWGLAHYNKGFPGTTSLRADTYLLVVEDVSGSLWENGFMRLVVLNGHGENAPRNRLARDTLTERDVFVITCSWLESVDDLMTVKGDRDADVGHGSEWDTIRTAMRK